MRSLGSLGSRPRRSGTNGVLGGAVGKLTSPTEWTIESNEWPSTVSHAVVNSWTRWKELAYPGSGLTASSSTIAPWKVGQVLKLPAAWVPNAPAPVASGDYGLPFKVGVKDPTALKWQYMLNTELGARSLPTVPEDGVFNAATCAGFVAFIRSYQQDPNNPTPDDTFAAVVVQNQKAIVAACQALTATPAAPAPVQAPKPAAPAVSPTDLMKQQQTMLNKWLVSVGYRPIAVTGVWDGPTCGAGQLMTRTLPDSDPSKIALAAVLAKIKPVLGMPCGVTVTPTAPSRPVVVVPPAPVPTASPSVRSSSLPPLNRDGECVVNFGQRFAEIGALQQQLNATLVANGYKPIPITNVWDAATCGAMFELGGKFSPNASGACPNYYSVPLTCPTVTKPVKPAVPIAPPPAPPKQANMLLPIGIAAVAGVVALVVAKKKGLIMAGAAA